MEVSFIVLSRFLADKLRIWTRLKVKTMILAELTKSTCRLKPAGLARAGKARMHCS